MTHELFDRRPIVVAVAGPNGAGKSTFYDTHLRMSGLRFVNADELARELGLDPYAAAAFADVLRRNLVAARESFVFETVLSDPDGAKVTFLRELSEAGYVVVLCFVGLANVEISDQRVAMRVAQGGHDVPRAKLEARFSRSLKNLERALAQLPYVHVHVYDNTAFGRAHKLLAQVHQQQLVFCDETSPLWFQPYLDRLRET